MQRSSTLTSGETSSWHLIQRLLGLGWAYRWGCIKVLVLQMILLALGLSGLGFTGLGIDEIRHAADPSVPPPEWPFGTRPPESVLPMTILAIVSALVFGFAALRSALNYLYTVAVNELVQGQIVVHLRAKLYDRMQRLSFRFFDANATSSLINRVTGDVQSVRMFVDSVIIQVLIMVLSLGVYLIYMLHIHVGLTFACLATTPLLWFLSASFSNIVKPAYRTNRELVDRMVHRLSESLRGVEVIKAFGREPEELERFRSANEVVRKQQRWIFWRVSLFTPAIGFLSQVNLVVLLAYGGWLVIEGQLPLGTGMIVFAGILQQFSGQVANLGNVANSIQQSLTGARRVFEVLDAPLEIHSKPGAKTLGRVKGHLRFENVWFDHGQDPVLKDVSFEVQPGQCIALVGATGAGKSQLMSLIPRFYDPTGGRILLDGNDLRDVELDSLRRNVGLVFQESFLFSTTVAANIAFGHPEAQLAQIEHAARIAAAHDFIMELPNGYETVLGEAGIGLSGGQRQRLAIARAVLLEPPILLLDDPTAAVDPGTEHEIAEAMNSAMESRTTFIVAHRLSMLRRADLIIVLDHGRIVQIGTQKELQEQEGYFRDAAHLQVSAS